jgi:SAM-dependent methyltransferase
MNLKGEAPERFGPLRSWFYSRFAEPLLTPLHLRVGSEVPIEKGRLLDVGCGPGRLDRALAAARPDLRVVGIDSSPAMLRRAERGPKLSNLEFREATVEEADFREEFDFALAVLTFHHWEEPVRGLEAVHRALKPGGRFWIYEGNPQSPTDELLRDQAPRWGWLRPPIGFLRRALHHHGFTIEEMETVVLPAVAETSFGTGEISPRGSTLRLALTK